MKLYLVRHTKVEVPHGTCYGQTDVGLADSFQYEREAIVNKLNGIHFNVFYSSPLARCMKLSDFLKTKLDLPEIRVDDRLKEMYFGLWEGKQWSSIENEPEAKNWFKDFVNIPCPGGENYLQVAKRCQEFLDEIKNQENENVLVVTHGGIIRAMYALVKGNPLKDAFDFEVNFGDIIELEL